MANLALYRKYRSADFSEVIGQKHVVETLETAIATGRISHAYLFTGPRGVGKTSVARILARAVNCTGENQKKPCGKCQNCQLGFGANLDLIEIDAASNRRIDEIRELRDKIGLAPTQSRYKVYIIDEVHMLTTEAFNALLKTLEEPPAHAIFVLATTEAHKLPETIVSRTQRFSFKPIVTADIVRGLGDIAAKEKIKIEPLALETIARASRGGMRDAISLLDQVSNLSKEEITAAQVRMVLGWSDTETIDALSEAIIDKNTPEAIRLIDESVASGNQAGQIIVQLLEQWRQIMRHAAGVVVGGPEDSLVSRASQTLSLPKIAEIVDVLASASRSTQPQLALEVAIVRLTSRPGAQPQQSPAPSSLAATMKPAKSQPHTTEPPVQPEQPTETTDQTPAPKDMPELWLKALMLIKTRNNSLYALLRSCGTSFQTDSVVISCRFNFHRDRLTEAKNRQIIDESVVKAFGRPLKVLIQLEAAQPAAPAPADTTAELVSSALEILGGEVVE